MRFLSFLVLRTKISPFAGVDLSFYHVKSELKINFNSRIRGIGTVFVEKRTRSGTFQKGGGAVTGRKNVFLSAC